MRFRTKQRPRGLLRGRDQRRLSLLIGAFGLILLSITFVRRPQFWNGLFPESDNQAHSTSDPMASEQPTESADSPSEIQYDEFLLGGSDAVPTDNVTVTARKVPIAEVSEASTTERGIPRVPNELLRSVRDDVIGVHSTETDVYYAAMKMASRLSKEHLRRVPRGAYALFVDSPDGSRGQAYRIDGQLRQLSVAKGQANAYGVGGTVLYDAWITTPDSGNQLVHVVSMKADKSLRSHISNASDQADSHIVRFMGPDAPRVHFTGYFFKREGYASHQVEGLSIAPLFVAGTLFEDVLPVVTHTRADQITPYLGWLAVAVAGGILFMVWSFTLSDVAHASTRTHQLTKLPAHASFDDVTSKTVGEVLREMETQTARAPGTLDVAT